MVLLKNVFVGCFPLINYYLLDFNCYKIKIVLNNPSKRKTLINYLCSKKNVVKITELIGCVDLDFDVFFKSTFELDSFLEKMRIDVSEIKDFEVINIIN